MTVRRDLAIRLFILSGWACAVSVNASPGDQKRAFAEVQIGVCIAQAAGGTPWIEKTLWALRDQEGGWIGAEVPNLDGSLDLGPMQINSRWVSRLSTLTKRSKLLIHRWLRDDACFNVDTARWLFISALAVTGDYWKAIGSYHSPTAWRQRRYASAIARRLVTRFGPTIFRAERVHAPMTTRSPFGGSAPR